MEEFEFKQDEDYPDEPYVMPQYGHAMYKPGTSEWGVPIAIDDTAGDQEGSGVHIIRDGYRVLSVDSLYDMRHQEGWRVIPPHNGALCVMRDEDNALGHDCGEFGGTFVVYDADEHVTDQAQLRTHRYYRCIVIRPHWTWLQQQEKTCADGTT